jgi:hypothetical protein
VAEQRTRANELIAYHTPISKKLTAERTSLESKLIPVTAYIVIACAESYLRYADIVRRIDAAMPAEEIGRRARRPGCQVDTCYLWSIANFPLVGRKVYGLIDPTLDTPERLHTILDFWERAALGYRADGTRTAADTASATPYDDVTIGAILDATFAVDDPDERTRIKRFSATLVNYLFLLYFDTRAGYGDTGPYAVPGQPKRRLLVRDFYRLGHSDYWWSDVAAGVPYQNLTAAFVLEDVEFTVTDFGTSNHTPEDYLDHVVGFGLFTTDGGDLKPVDLAELDAIVAAVRTAQAAHYRNIAAMARDDKIRCGAYVYFSFLRPFALEAGVADDIDWTVPRDLPAPAYELLSAIEGDNSGVDDDAPYYDLLPEPPDG